MTFGFAGTALLGAVAGCTIFLGLPVARFGRPTPRRMSFLNATSIGILLFLLFDVLKQASETVEPAVRAHRASGLGYALLLVAGFAVGLLGLVVFEHRTLRRKRPFPSGPGAMAAGGSEPMVRVGREPLTPAHRVALFIAVGIGLHNFSEGLAIGQSAASGVYQLLALLVIGFGLHNITEGFGITAPLVGERPSWGFLLSLGLIGGGPTLLGTLLGYQLSSPAMAVLFLAMAAGAIVYVVGELQHAGRKIGSHDVAMVGLFTGFLIAYGTDLLLVAAGA